MKPSYLLEWKKNRNFTFDIYMIDIKKIFMSLSHLVLTLAISLIAMQIFNIDYGFDINTAKRLIIILSPVLMLYLIFSCFFKKRLCLYFIALILVSLMQIARKKYYLTDSSLIWSDLFEVQNFKIAVKYCDPIVSMVAIYLFLVSIVLIRKYHNVKNIKTIFSRAFLCILILPVVAPMNLSRLSENVPSRIIKAITPDGGKYYESYHWELNIKNNGVLTHLIQTSSRYIPKETTLSNERYINSFSYPATPSENVIYILCESCWKDKAFFSDSFKPLLDIEMQEISIISPAYGGGTANAEFEMYTGLPAKSVLDGIVFQEYASIFSDDSLSLASSLKKSGYSTVALHNFFKKNWRRNEILNKLGFSKFISLEDMVPNTDEITSFPDDSVLYKTAFNTIDSIDKNKKNFFLSLITVSTHGPYTDANEYKNKLNKSIVEMAKFIKEVNKKHPNTLFVVYGDHKPSLTDFFIENKVISSLDDQQDIIGKVPAFVLGASKVDVDLIKRKANNLPMYCLSSVVDAEVIKSGNPITKFMSQKVCDSNANYEQRLNTVNADLYWVSFFNDRTKK